MCDTSKLRRHRLLLANVLLTWGGLVLSGLAAGEGGADLSEDRLLALVRPEVAERVKLTAQQKAEIDRITEQLYARLQDLVNSYPRGAQDTEGVEGRRKTLKEVARSPRWREEAARRIRGVLTAEQRAALARLGEELFTVPTGSATVEHLTSEQGHARLARLRALGGHGQATRTPPRARSGIRVAPRIYLCEPYEDIAEFRREKLSDGTSLERKAFFAYVRRGGKVVAGPFWHPGYQVITGHAFSPSGHSLLTVSVDLPSSPEIIGGHGQSELCLWDLRTGVLQLSTDVKGEVETLALADDETVLVHTTPINGH